MLFEKSTKFFLLSGRAVFAVSHKIGGFNRASWRKINTCLAEIVVYCKIPVKYVASARALTVFKTYNAKERVTCRRQRKKIRIFFLLVARSCDILRSVRQRGAAVHPAAHGQQLGGGFAYSIFILTVLLISRFTTGYLFGTLAAVLSVVGTNYIFTYPYWAVNFTLSGYPLTFLTMLVVSLVTCTMTTKIKRQEDLRIEAAREKMRANLLRSVSHDIRTPLTSIIGSTSAMIENPDLPEEDRLLLLTDVRDDAQWLIRVVENLLSITRMGDTTTRLVKNPEPAEEESSAR